MNDILMSSSNGRKRRGHSRFAFIYLVILLVLTGLLWAAYEGLRSADWLNVKEIRVHGNEFVSSSSIHEILKQHLGENLLNISNKEVTNSLLRIKRIREVKMRRLYPSTLSVKITEKPGFLYIKSVDGDLFPIDSDGMIIEYVLSANHEDLPIVHSEFSSQQLTVGSIVKDPFIVRIMNMHKRIIDERPDFVKTISEYYREGNHVMIVDVRNGSRILMGDDDISNQIRRYQFVQDNGNVDRARIFDLRFKNQVVVRPEVQ